MKRVNILLLAAVMLLSSCGKQISATDMEHTPGWQEQYDLGVRYLSEGNYEEAIIAFTAAIEIDPKRAEAYEKLADTYVALGDNKSALEILQQGVEATGDTDLQARLEELGAPSGPREEREIPKKLAGSFSPDFYGEIPVLNLSQEVLSRDLSHLEGNIPEGLIGYTYLHFDLDLSAVPQHIVSQLRSHGIWNWDEEPMSPERARECCAEAYGTWGSQDFSTLAPLTHCDSWGFPTFEEDAGKIFCVCIVYLDGEGRPIAYSLPSAPMHWQ